MGPSGCGKSMLMEVISGKRVTDAEWTVKENVSFIERDLHAEQQNADHEKEIKRDDFKPDMGYVPQDDVAYEFLSVRENVYFSAAKRMPIGSNKQDLDEVTNDVLGLVGLVEKQNAIVGNRMQTGSGLSGGQKKRVSVGIELAACPRVLFLDEPTSSLDSPSALGLVQNLKNLATLGVTVVMVIHQPRYDLFQLVDDVILLASGGRMAYCGPTTTAVGYFSALGYRLQHNMNPADWMIDILCGQNLAEVMPSGRELADMKDVPDEIVKAWKRNPRPQRAPIAISLERAASVRSETLMYKLYKHWRAVLGGRQTADLNDFTKVLIDLAPGENVTLENARQIAQNFASRSGEITRKDFINHVLDMDGSGVIVLDPDFDPSESEPSEPERSSDSSDASADCDGWWWWPKRKPSRNRGSSSSSSGTSVTRWRLAIRPRAQYTDCQDRPGFCRHLICSLQVSLLELDRGWLTELSFLMIVALVGALLSFLTVYVFHDPTWSPNAILNVQVAQAFLISIYSLRVFSNGKEMFWREASHGLNRAAFFLGRLMVHDLGLCLQTAVYVVVCYLIMSPMPLLYYIWPFILVSYVACGWGVAVSCCLPPSMGPFTCSILAFVTGGILGMPPQMSCYLDGGIGELLVSCLSYSRWSVEMTFQECLAFVPPDESELDGMDMFQLHTYQNAYGQARFILPGDEHHWWSGVLWLLAQGLALRCFAFMGLCLKDRARQA
ncbi:unnamed protein product [Durusdinium trenchii]|uniref:Broad substrate specificity ATP-binding cassette transporter ABCG2 (ATP-binding cassette sub-family G member 2) (Urate exporter) (CD antigen CD338) n=2 Tax=Durusdinium trenchii TaxID=1381693 RepID=A0ABP0MUK3_9DINO